MPQSRAPSGALENQREGAWCRPSASLPLRLPCSLHANLKKLNNIKYGNPRKYEESSAYTLDSCHCKSPSQSPSETSEGFLGAASPQGNLNTRTAP